jgi:mono/diheme cytochrome c family protein
MILKSFRVALCGIGILITHGLGNARAQGAAPDADLVARGSYLARAADCMPCHSSSQDKPYAGGLKINTPFGVIYSPNVTPDPDTGIGEWSFEDFKKAVRAGIRADGAFLYPAMPFDSYTRITEDDLKALWAYFQTLQPIKQQNRDNELSFPFNIRYGMLAWRWLYFAEDIFKPDAAKGPRWNRGAYLVEALGHCGSCHTPRNFMGATIDTRQLQGARIDEWYAPDISPAALKAVNKWDKAQLVAFLKKGAAGNSTALGPMQEVVHDGLAYLTDNDLDAMATYLLDLPAPERAADSSSAARLAPEVEARAAKLYGDNCGSCHQAEGQGVAGSIPPLAGNPAVVAGAPFNVLAAVLEGIPARDNMPAMPSFAGALADQDIADIANYVRTSWGNSARVNATPELVATLRVTLSLPAYASDSARQFECPMVGTGGDPSFDPSLIAVLGGDMRQRGVAYAQLVDMYKAQHPAAGMDEIVNNMVAAYCPIVAATAMLDQAKSMAVKQFALDLSSYVASRTVAEAEPTVGIIWAVPLGYSLAARLPAWQPALDCPPDDGSLVAPNLVKAAQAVAGKPNLNFLAKDAIAQADTMAAQNPTAKPADVANALILAYCQGVVGVSGVDVAQKQAGLARYGEVVIEELQKRAEMQARPTAAKGAP